MRTSSTNPDDVRDVRTARVSAGRARPTVQCRRDARSSVELLRHPDLSAGRAPGSLRIERSSRCADWMLPGIDRSELPDRRTRAAVRPGRGDRSSYRMLPAGVAAAWSVSIDRTCAALLCGARRIRRSANQLLHDWLSSWRGHSDRVRVNRAWAMRTWIHARSAQYLLQAERPLPSARRPGGSGSVPGGNDSRRAPSRMLSHSDPQVSGRRRATSVSDRLPGRSGVAELLQAGTRRSMFRLPWWIARFGARAPGHAQRLLSRVANVFARGSGSAAAGAMRFYGDR